MKNLWAFLLVIILPSLSYGQIQVGIMGGYHYFWFSHPEDGHYVSSYNYPNDGFVVGASICQRSLNTFNPGIEIEYVHKSFSVQSSWGGLGGGSTANFNYSLGNIYLKLMPQFAFGSKVRFNFYPGIFFGVLVNSTLTGTLYHWQMGTPYISQTDTINGSARDYYPDFEFGIAPGIGLEVPVYHGLSLVFDYTFRMNLYPVSASWGSTKVKMFNMDFVVGCAYTFGNK